MNLLQELVLGALSVSGLLIGFVLSFLAPEERLLGKKQFLVVKSLFFVAVASFMIGVLIKQLAQPWLLLFFIPAALLFYGTSIRQQPLAECGTYFLFGTSLFFIAGNFQLVAASLLFLYGLPTGTLLRKMPAL